jgi:oligoribonuclease NrnB/cAMP/cGMP phosphodiesterase (DHH superfamily)
MKCFYHNDADGKCSAFWVYYNLKDNLKGYLSEDDFIEMSYAKQFPFKIISEDEPVYIVDFSISPDEMRQLLEITKNVTWIDHHKTAIEKYKDFEHEIEGIRYDGIAACMLTYCYFKHMWQGGEHGIKYFDISMTEDAPLFTKLIADWDVWKFEFGNDTRHFITAFNTYNFNPVSNFYDILKLCSNHYGNKLTEEGILMIKFRDGWARDYMKLGFEVYFQGLTCFAVNLGHCNSDYFKSLPEGKYDIFMPFVFDGNVYTVSLYSKTVDVSKIAKRYNGGGHKGAAGFQCKELPFVKDIIKSCVSTIRCCKLQLNCISNIWEFNE